MPYWSNIVLPLKMHHSNMKSIQVKHYSISYKSCMDFLYNDIVIIGRNLTYESNYTSVLKDNATLDFLRQ